LRRAFDACVCARICSSGELFFGTCESIPCTRSISHLGVCYVARIDPLALCAYIWCKLLYRFPQAAEALALALRHNKSFVSIRKDCAATRRFSLYVCTPGRYLARRQFAGVVRLLRRILSCADQNLRQGSPNTPRKLLRYFALTFAFSGFLVLA
jgi:hypothetical protein